MRCKERKWKKKNKTPNYWRSKRSTIDLINPLWHKSLKLCLYPQTTTLSWVKSKQMSSMLWKWVLRHLHNCQWSIKREFTCTRVNKARLRGSLSWTGRSKSKSCRRVWRSVLSRWLGRRGSERLCARLNRHWVGLILSRRGSPESVCRFCWVK